MQPYESVSSREMNKNTMKKIKFTLFTLLLVLLLGHPLKAQVGITSGTAGWITLILNNGNLSAGIGSALVSTYESNANQITLDITGTLGGNYSVNISKSDTLWDASVTISAKRTGVGIGPGSVAGGLAYQAIGADALFFTGTNDNSAIDVQLQLSGVTISVPPNIYTTTITFTVGP